MTYTIRPVRPTDLAAVTEVEAICFPAAEAAAEESFKARIAAFPECFFVADKSREPMPYNAVSDLFAGGNSDSRVLPSRIHHVHDQIFVCVGLPSPVNRLEILIFL